MTAVNDIVEALVAAMPSEPYECASVRPSEKESKLESKAGEVTVVTGGLPMVRRKGSRGCVRDMLALGEVSRLTRLTID